MASSSAGAASSASSSSRTSSGSGAATTTARPPKPRLALDSMRRVAGGPSQRGGLREARPGGIARARAIVRVPQRHQQLRTVGRRRAGGQRGREVRGGVGVRERLCGLARRRRRPAATRSAGASGAAAWRCDATRPGRATPDASSASATRMCSSRPSRGGQGRGDRLRDERVREAEPIVRAAHHEPRRDGLVERIEEVSRRPLSRLGHTPEIEPQPEGGGEGEHLASGVSEARETTVHHLANPGRRTLRGARRSCSSRSSSSRKNGLPPVRSRYRVAAAASTPRRASSTPTASSSSPVRGS